MWVHQSHVNCIKSLFFSKSHMHILLQHEHIDNVIELKSENTCSGDLAVWTTASGHSYCTVIWHGTLTPVITAKQTHYQVCSYVHTHRINAYPQTRRDVTFYPHPQHVLFTWSKAFDLLIPLQDNRPVMVLREHVNYSLLVVAIVTPTIMRFFEGLTML